MFLDKFIKSSGTGLDMVGAGYWENEEVDAHGFNSKLIINYPSLTQAWKWAIKARREDKT